MLTRTSYSQYQFNKFSEDQGLSSNHVRAILQDNEGFVWIATTNGLVRYDGEDFSTFYNIPGDSTSITDNYLLALNQDIYGHIWIGTNNGGVNVLNPQTLRFIHFQSMFPKTVPFAYKKADTNKKQATHFLIIFFTLWFEWRMDRIGSHLELGIFYMATTLNSIKS